MSKVGTFEPSTTLTVSDEYGLTTRQDHSKKRSPSACRCLTRIYSFRVSVWQVLLFLFVVAVLIAVLGLVIAMFGPGNTELKYSKKTGTDSPDNTGGEEPTKATTRSIEERTTAPVKPIEQRTTAPTGQTTAGPTTNPPATTKEQPSTTEAPTTSPPTTQPPTTQPPPTTVPSDKTSLDCGVAIVGGGTGGLLMAYALQNKTKETNVCIFEREDRLGGKIFDFSFTQAPDVVVGLGEWNIHGDNYLEFDLGRHLTIQVDRWIPKTRRVEARGVYVDSFDSLKPNAFPTLLNRVPMNNKTLVKTAEYIYDNARNYSQFSSAETFLFNELSPEGATLMENTYGFLGDYMQAINPLSYRKYLEKHIFVIYASADDKRPKKGMFEFVTDLEQKVRSYGGKTFLKETVTSIDKRGQRIVLQTTNFTVKANKTVITTGPTALKNIKGDIIQNITDHEIFKSIVSVPAFHGAAVYDKAWWNDSIAVQRNNSLQPLDMFISSSNCLGITMPYKGVGPSGTAVLHTIGNNGGCSDKWGKILQMSAKEADKELKGALKYKFQRDVPDPLETKYQYWDEGFWFLQKPGANFPLATIQQWAKRPLTGQDVFLVDRAFYSFGGWLDDTIQAALDTLKEGWNLDFTL